MSDIDILTVDSEIKQHFVDELDNLPIYKSKLDDLEHTLHTKNLKQRFVNILKKEIEELKVVISHIESGYDRNFYVAETAEYIEKYKIILRTPIKMSFLGKPIHNMKEKSNVISKYLEKAQSYTELGVDKVKKNNRIICNNCPNKKTFDIIDECVYICLMCGAQQDILLHTSSYKDTDRVNISSKYTYDRKVHFRDCINQYQGKQNCTIDPKVYVELEDQFERHHLLKGKKGDKKELRFSNITKNHIHLFLKELEFTKHYENINLIHYNMTGKKPDDISHLEDLLLNDFDALTELYDKQYKNKVGFDRKNFINTQYVLYQLLTKYKHYCGKDDFTILKTMERKSFHDSITSDLFQQKGWNFSPLF